MVIEKLGKFIKSTSKGQDGHQPIQHLDDLEASGPQRKVKANSIPPNLTQAEYERICLHISLSNAGGSIKKVWPISRGRRNTFDDVLRVSVTWKEMVRYTSTFDDVRPKSLPQTPVPPVYG